MSVSRLFVEADLAAGIEAPLGEETMDALETLAYELGSDVTEQLLDEGVEHDGRAAVTGDVVTSSEADTSPTVRSLRMVFLKGWGGRVSRPVAVCRAYRAGAARLWEPQAAISQNSSPSSRSSSSSPM